MRGNKIAVISVVGLMLLATVTIAEAEVQKGWKHPKQLVRSNK